jgi:HK97 family phage portal protein
MLRRVLSWLGFDGLYIQEGSQNPQPMTHNGPSPEPVSFETAMQLSAVWASARLLSEAVAGLPLEIHDGKGNPVRSDVSELFAGKVNRYQTRFEFMETMMLNLVMRGNCYALKQYSGNRLVGLLPLMASQVETRLLPDGTVVHVYYADKDIKVYSADSVWHVRLFGNGIVGLSPLGYARNTIGIALAGEKRVSHVFQNGGKPSGVLMVDKLLTDKQREQVRNEFNELREGNNDRLMVLEADMKYQTVSMSPEDIQLLESRRFQIEDLARFFGVPSVLINDTSGSTTWGSGIEQLVQGFYKLNLRPYLERFEASIKHNLMAPGVRSKSVVEFNFDALLRGDRAGRADARQKEINSGQITPNEARAEEGREPLAGGDVLYVNSTMIPITQAVMPMTTPEGRNNGV